MLITIIDRFQPQRRRAWQMAADEDRLRVVDELEVFDPEQIVPLARFSLQLLVMSGIFFVILNLLAYSWRTGQHGASLSFGLVVLWILLNMLSYALVLPLHELLHGLAFAFWGGRPHFGAKLPLALYCGAKAQAFPRNYYLVIGLAPLVIITLAGLIFTLLAPGLSPFVLLATIGNISGAASDIQISRRLLNLPASIFIEDLETGYRAWEMTPQVQRVTIEPGA